MIAVLRQVNTNKETVQQQTMKDLHVKYPKQTGRQIHLKSGRWRRIKSLLLNSSFSQCQSGAGDNMSVCKMTCAFVILKAFKHSTHFLFLQIN